PDFFHADFDVRKVNKALDQIPPDADVSASSTFLSHVAQRKNIYQFPDVRNADYIALLCTHDYWLLSPEAYQKEVFKYMMDSNWSVIASEYPFVLLKRGAKISNANNFKGKPGEMNVTGFKCDAETISTDGSHLVSDKGDLINNPDARNDEKAHSGKYSVKLTKDRPYGFTWIPHDVIPGEIIKVTVWRYSESGKGLLVASAEDGFSIGSQEVVEKDAAGWGKIVLTLFVPVKHSNFGIYVWNETNGNDAVWFDDMQVEVYKYQTPGLN
ncbi:MAG TPA: DUF2079 domain-containing protein, partial [Bacteroidia bacterium]|nr:DUF2079 domain-containing protein [Bacteroidia bacterium]